MNQVATDALVDNVLKRDTGGRRLGLLELQFTSGRRKNGAAESDACDDIQIRLDELTAPSLGAGTELVLRSCIETNAR
jgi:hypothetical protein